VTGFPGIAPSTVDHVGDDRFQLLQRRNWGGDLIEQRTLNFNSMRRQEYAARPLAMRIIEGDM
jgi:hypothetical protein